MTKKRYKTLDTIISACHFYDKLAKDELTDEEVADKLNEQDDEIEMLHFVLDKKVEELNVALLFIIKKGLMEEFVRTKDD